MGEVYEADDLELGERVALKAIRRHVALDADCARASSGKSSFPGE